MTSIGNQTFVDTLLKLIELISENYLLDGLPGYTIFSVKFKQLI